MREYKNTTERNLHSMFQILIFIEFMIMLYVNRIFEVNVLSGAAHGLIVGVLIWGIDQIETGYGTKIVVLLGMMGLHLAIGGAGING